MAQSPPRPELLALLAAVKDEPDDDTPKFALADWLQEQDDEADRARGEFVRYVTQYHRSGEEPPGAWKLRDQFLTLWEHYHPAWLGPLPGSGFEFPLHVANAYARGPLLTARGNGSDLTSQRAATIAGAEAYAWVDGLELFTVNGRQLSKFAHSRLLESLAALTLSRGNTPLESIRDLVVSPKIGRLRRLSMNYFPVVARDIAASHHLSALRSLQLVGAQLTDDGFKALCESPHLKQLRSLDVGGNGLSIHAARAFADRTGLSAVTELNLSGPNHIGPDGTLILVASETTGRLRKLYLSDNGIADYGVEAICRQPHMCNLTHLDVSSNLLTNRSAFAIADSPHLESLEQLLLFGNTVGDEGALALARSPHLGSIRWLFLVGNPISASAAGALRERFGNAVVL